MWFQEYRNLKDISLCLDPKYKITLHENHILEIDYNEKYIPAFFELESDRVIQ